MIFLLNTEISNKKALNISLQSIFGIGKHKANKILIYFGISKKATILNLSNNLRNNIISFIEKNFQINEELKQNLVKIKEQNEKIKIYRGQRLRLKLPCRGQRSHTNARTIKKINVQW